MKLPSRLAVVLSMKRWWLKQHEVMETKVSFCVCLCVFCFVAVGLVCGLKNWLNSRATQLCKRQLHCTDCIHTVFEAVRGKASLAVHCVSLKKSRVTLSLSKRWKRLISLHLTPSGFLSNTVTWTREAHLLPTRFTYQEIIIWINIFQVLILDKYNPTHITLLFIKVYSDCVNRN